MVGTSGRNGLRLVDDTAIARIWPPLIWPMAPGIVSNAAWIVPVSSPVITSPVVRCAITGTFNPAIDTNCRVERFCAVPVAIEPKLNLSGLALAASITSFTVLSGLSLCTNSTKSKVAIGPIGVKSRDQS